MSELDKLINTLGEKRVIGVLRSIVNKEAEKVRDQAVEKVKHRPIPQNKTIPSDAIVAYVDGGCSSDMIMSAAWAIEGGDHSSVVLGVGTNNQAEYKALLLFLTHAKYLGIRKLYVKMDSQLVVKQVASKWACNDVSLHLLRDEVRRLLPSFDYFNLVWIPRHENLADKYT